MNEILFEENFESGFEAGSPEENKKWYYMSMGPISMSLDAYDVDSENGLRVRPKGKNKKTGEAAFTVTADQKLGQVDHIKWSALANHMTPSGMPGFITSPGKKISFEAVMGGRTYGNEGHPFGDAVSDPQSDLRLGDAVLMVMAPEYMIVFDFFITNTKIYAIYERGRSMGHADADDEAYSFGIPVADRRPEDIHKLRITYDPDKNDVAWFVDDKEVYRAEHVGMLIDRAYMYIDNGGTAREVKSNYFQSGLALFTLLDGAREGVGLVNLTGADIYCNPQKGEPEKAAFVDPESKESSRIFGQGAELFCRRFTVYYE